MGGEDFAWFLHKAPGAMARFRHAGFPGGRTYDLHQGDLIVDEAAIPAGATLLAATALEAIARHTAGLRSRLRNGCARSLIGVRAGNHARLSFAIGWRSGRLPSKEDRESTLRQMMKVAAVMTASTLAPRRMWKQHQQGVGAPRVRRRVPRPPPAQRDHVRERARGLRTSRSAWPSTWVGRGDQSFNDAAAAGLDKAKAEFGMETKEATAVNDENDAAREERLNQLIDAGYTHTSLPSASRMPQRWATSWGEPRRPLLRSSTTPEDPRAPTSSS